MPTKKNRTSPYADVHDEASKALLIDALAYADALLEQSAAASMAPTDLHPFESAAYLDACNVLQHTVTVLEETPIALTCRQFVGATQSILRSQGVNMTDRVIVDDWVRARVKEMHSHTTRTEVLPTGELRKAKQFHYRWSNNDSLCHGKFETSDATWFIVDRQDFEPESEADKPALLLRCEHVPEMYYDLDGRITPYLGQYVPNSQIDGRNNQRAYVTSAVSVARQMTTYEAMEVGAMFAAANRAAALIERITKEVAAAEAAPDAESSESQAAADPLAEARRAVFRS